MKRFLICIFFAFFSAISFSQAWRVAQIEDRFGEKTRDVVYLQNAEGKVVCSSLPSIQTIGMGFYPESNRILPNVLAFYLQGYNYIPLRHHQYRSRVTLSVRDFYGRVFNFKGWQTMNPNGISVQIDRNKDLAKLLEQNQVFAAVLQSYSWTCSFQIYGGLPR